ncbi:MAG: hypothetical protein LBT86_10710 [Deltaproteobacteria bacterium]|jgi:hypothetical protein|nr:hypothetical protein [Deltaproteobacteria bacterium]
MEKNMPNQSLVTASKIQRGVDDLRAILEGMGKKSELDESTLNYINKLLDNIALVSKLVSKGTSSDTNFLSLTNFEDLLLHLNKTHEEAAKDLILDKMDII